MNLTEALQNYQQADSDGVMVLVSRQACDQAVAEIKRLRELRLDLEYLAERCRSDAAHQEMLATKTDDSSASSECAGMAIANTEAALDIEDLLERTKAADETVCGTCRGTGVVDETLDGISTSNSWAECPDCEGAG